MTAKYITLDEALRKSDADQSWRNFQVDYPEDQEGRFRIERFDIPRLDEGRLDIMRREGLDRDPGYGSFTKLVEIVPGAGEEGKDLKRVWMSDTRAEIMEHSPFFNRLPVFDRVKPLRILVNGLGLGLVAKGALNIARISHIDVVEINPDVANLVRRHLPEDKVTVHIDDSYTKTWPRGKRWDMAWHDIWPAIDDDNLPGMDKLLRRYKSRVTFWQGCWQRAGCLRMADAMKRLRNGTMSMEEAYSILDGRWPI